MDYYIKVFLLLKITFQKICYINSSRTWNEPTKRALFRPYYVRSDGTRPCKNRISRKRSEGYHLLSLYSSRPFIGRAKNSVPQRATQRVGITFYSPKSLLVGGPKDGATDTNERWMDCPVIYE